MKNTLIPWNMIELQTKFSITCLQCSKKCCAILSPPNSRCEVITFFVYVHRYIHRHIYIHTYIHICVHMCATYIYTQIKGAPLNRNLLLSWRIFFSSVSSPGKLHLFVFQSSLFVCLSVVGFVYHLLKTIWNFRTLKSCSRYHICKDLSAADGS